MNAGYERVCRGREYGKSFDGLPRSRIFPGVPQPGKREDSIVRHSKVVGLLLFRPQPLPLVKSIGGNKAAPPAHCVTESRFLSRSLRHSVDGLETDGGI